MEFNEARPFGIEIEAYNVRSSILETKLTAAGIPCRNMGYTHVYTPYWKIVHDGSIRGLHAFELVSPKLFGAAGLDEVRQVLAILQRLGAKVNASCGLHVHHSAEGMATANHRNVAYSYSYFYPLFKELFPMSRQNNHFCRVVDPTQAQGIHRSRYEAVNLEALLRHGTIEFRQHAGTLNPTKVTAWVVFTQGLMEAGLKMKRLPRRRDDPKERMRGLKTVLGLYEKTPLDANTAAMLRYVASRRVWHIGRLLARREVRS